MLLKTTIILMLIAILASLFTALFRLLHTQNAADRAGMVKALTIRVGLSITLFVLLLIGFRLGIIPALK